MLGNDFRKTHELYGETDLNYDLHGTNNETYYALGEQPEPRLNNHYTSPRKVLSGGGGSLPMTTKIYDIGNSILMGLDVLGTVTEMHSNDPVTIGGKACKRNRDYIKSLVPEDYEPGLSSDMRVRKYFKEEGLEVAPINIYAGWISTFFSWPLFLVIQPINLYNKLRQRREERALKHRLQTKPENGTD